MSAAPNVDKLSTEAFGKGNSEEYEASRPKYDPQIVAAIRKRVPKESGINVVEIGSGTGLFTRALITHPDWTNAIASLHAIDPNDGMREVFEKAVTDPRVKLTNGTFDNTGVEDGWADIIVMAAAIHWCLDFEAAVKEFSRILKLEGVVVLVWYDTGSPDIPDRPEYVQRIYATIKAYDTRADPGRTHDRWRAIFDAPSYSTLFHPAETETVSTAVTMTKERLTAFVLTASWIAVLPDETKAEVRKKLMNVLDTAGGIEWVDKEKGIFNFYRRHIAVYMRKK